MGQGQEETQTVRQNIRERTAYNYSMAKDVIHISETEAASDFAALMSLCCVGPWAKQPASGGPDPIPRHSGSMPCPDMGRVNIP